MIPHRLRDVGYESGSMLPMFGALVFISVLVVALVVDIAMLQMSYRRTASTADRIVEAAAAMVDVAHLRDQGAVVLDPIEAAEVASELAVSERMLAQMTIEVVSGRICVEVRDQYDVVALRIIAGDSVPVIVRSCAEPRSG